MLGKCALHDTQQDNGRNFIQERLQISASEQACECDCDTVTHTNTTLTLCNACHI